MSAGWMVAACFVPGLVVFVAMVAIDLKAKRRAARKAAFLAADERMRERIELEHLRSMLSLRTRQCEFYKRMWGEAERCEAQRRVALEAGETGGIRAPIDDGRDAITCEGCSLCDPEGLLRDRDEHTARRFEVRN